MWVAPILEEKELGKWRKEMLSELSGASSSGLHSDLSSGNNDQRVLSGGLDPWGVGSANLGRPIFAPNLPENACLGKF